MKKENIYLACTLLIVFLFYLHTIPYPWRDFDENLVFKELIFPIPQNLHELWMYAKEFGFNMFFEASNIFYSKIGNLRCNPLNSALTMFIEMLLQKDAWKYHCLSLILHIINTGILFLCLKRIRGLSLPIISLLSLLWSLHPVNVESVLFACNWGALLAYSFAFSVFYLSMEER